MCSVLNTVALMTAANIILWDNRILRSKPTDVAVLLATAPIPVCR
jgi:hypothetical protein